MLSKKSATLAQRLLSHNFSTKTFSCSLLARNQNFLPKHTILDASWSPLCNPCVTRQTFVTSAHFMFNKATEKPPISNDLKKILEAQVGSGEQENKSATPKEAEASTSDAAGGGGMFSKENAWKYSLGFFTVWIGGLMVYVLIEWGKPRVDEASQQQVTYSFCYFLMTSFTATVNFLDHNIYWLIITIFVYLSLKRALLNKITHFFDQFVQRLINWSLV